MGERYTAGELARRVGVSARTVRFYDKKDLLKPVAYTESGYRLYDSRSVLLLQKIKLLQYAGLSLEQISRIAPFDYRYGFYENYSENQQDCFGWVYDQLQVLPGAAVLDMGSGHGNLWIRNWTRIPEGVTVTAVDKRNSAIDILEQFYLENKKFLQRNVKFLFLRRDLERSGIQSEKYDRIVANHLWDFIADKDALMEKAKSALGQQGFMLSTYSSYGFLEAVDQLLGSVAAGVDLTGLIAGRDLGRRRLEEKLRAHFAKVSCGVFQSCLTGIADAGVLTGYIQNSYPGEYAAHETMWKEAARKINQQIAREGALEIRTYMPLYECRQI